MTKDAGFRELFAKAKAAGLAAGEAAVPAAMVVYESEGLSDKLAEGGHAWYESEGACGFAWVKVRPGNSAFVRYLKKEGIVRGKAYSGGVDIWIREFDQSMERKAAAAGAMAKVLSEAGIRAYADSRMD